MKRLLQKLACSACCLLAVASPDGAAQTIAEGSTRPPAEFLVHARLYALQVDLETGARPIEDALRRAGVRVDARGQVMVEVLAPETSPPIDAPPFEAVGGRLQYRSAGSTFGWIPPTRVLEFAALVPAGHGVVPASPPVPDNQGPSLMGSDDHQGSGLGGAGVRIGIIDNGFAGLEEIVSLGLAPAPIKTWPDGADFVNDDDHGRLCFETAADHAPQADYYLYNVELRPLGQAVNEAIADGVDMISMSLSYFQTWDDGAGSSAQALQNASDAAIPVFVSAGNYRELHYQGEFSGLGSHEFGVDPVSGLADINWNLQVGVDSDGNICTDDTTLEVLLLWDRGGVLGPDLDLYLYDSDGFLLDASESIFGDREHVSTVNPGTAVRDYLIRVKQSGSEPVEFELFVTGGGGCTIADPSDVVEEGSTSPSANSPASMVLTCGAVSKDDYGFISPSVVHYSSIGPTNGGANAIDVVGPTGTGVFKEVTGSIIEHEDFNGTSCSTPNVAGAAAAFWSAHPDMTATAVAHLVERQAGLFADWGSLGKDTEFGSGGLFLHEYHADTVWIDTTFPIDYGEDWPLTFLTTAYGPYWRFADAVEAVAAGGRIVMIDHTESGSFDVTKDILLDSLGGQATLGGLP